MVACFLNPIWSMLVLFSNKICCRLLLSLLWVELLHERTSDVAAVQNLLLLATHTTSRGRIFGVWRRWLRRNYHWHWPTMHKTLLQDDMLLQMRSWKASVRKLSLKAAWLPFLQVRRRRWNNNHQPQQNFRWFHTVVKPAPEPPVTPLHFTSFLLLLQQDPSTMHIIITAATTTTSGHVND